MPTTLTKEDFIEMREQVRKTLPIELQANEKLLDDVFAICCDAYAHMAFQDFPRLKVTELKDALPT